MRTGSTLLNALLAEAKDVSHIPEFKFHQICESRRIRKLHRLSDRPILVLKKPAWFHEIYHYPRIPRLKNSKIIILVRDVHHVGSSVKKMTFTRFEGLVPPAVDDWIASVYWARVYRRLHHKFGPHHHNPNAIWVRYEDLIADPKNVMQQLFLFIGSEQKEGVDTYSAPRRFDWRWGHDDGGETIQSLEVQPPPPLSCQKRLLRAKVSQLRRVREVRALLGYTEDRTNEPEHFLSHDNLSTLIPEFAGYQKS